MDNQYEIKLGRSCALTVFKRFRDLKRIKLLKHIKIKDYQVQEGIVNIESFESIEEVECFLRKRGAHGIRSLEHGDIVTLYYGDGQESVLSLMYTTQRQMEYLHEREPAGFSVIHSKNTKSCFIVLKKVLMTQTEKLLRGVSHA